MTHLYIHMQQTYLPASLPELQFRKEKKNFSIPVLKESLTKKEKITHSEAEKNGCLCSVLEAKKKIN